MDSSSSVSSSPSPGAAKADGSSSAAAGWPPLPAGRKGVRKRRDSSPPSDAESRTVSKEHGPRRVKVQIDGHALVRKILLHPDGSYDHLASAIEVLLGSEDLKLSECEITYQNMEGDWLVLGETKWELFFASAKRIKITET